MIYASTARAAELVASETENNPFIAWDNLASGKTYDGTTTLAAGPAANAFTPATGSYWLPDVTTTTATLEIDMGGDVDVTFAGLVAHNLSDFGGSVTLQHSADGISWTGGGYGAATPTDNSPIAFRIVETTKRYWRFYFTGLTSGDDLAVGVAFVGAETVIPRRLYQGFAPIITPTEVALQSSVSVGGNVLGSTFVASGSTISTQINYVDPTFMRGAAWIDFQTKFNRGLPFFMAWRPTKYAQDVHYCWRDGAVIRPDNSGPRDLMSFTISARVYEG